MRSVSLAQARRIALAAQGFHRARPDPGAVTTRHIQRVIDTVGLIQIDSVNVLVRSHYLPFFSRLGAFDRTLVDRARDEAPRRLVEYWAHEAALIPPATWPLLRHRMASYETAAWPSLRRVQHEYPELIDRVREAVHAHGPMTSRECERVLEHERSRDRPDWGWNWSAVKLALEYLFFTGAITSAGRTPQFERRYAALDRVVPPGLRSQWLSVGTSPSALTWQDKLPRDEAACDEVVALMRIAARAHGIGSEACLADYFRLPRRAVRPALGRLVEEGVLEEVVVPGWGRRAYLHRDAARPRKVHVEALVSPFDSLVWQRERVEALFGVRYRIEIYTPAPQRVYGYYVLPFFFGDTIVARVDLKADRGSRRLLVQRVTWEHGEPEAAHPALGRELTTMAQWLGLSEISGDAVRALH